MQLQEERPREATQPVYTRIDGLERVTGRAKYTGDFQVDRMLYGRILTSKIAHGIVRKIDTSKALRIEGVKAILTCFDDPACLWANGEREHKRQVFTDHVRFVGDCIGAVAAQSRSAALDALEAISVEYEKLPSSFTVEDSLKSGATSIWDDGNALKPLKYGYGDLKAAFESADQIFEGTYSTSRLHNCPLEPAASLAWWEEEGDKLVVHAATQSIFGCRSGLSEDLGIPEEKIRVITLYKGGGFGNKSNSMNYDIIAALLSKKVAQPVMLEYSREDDFTSVHGRWSSNQKLRAAIDSKRRKLLAVDLVAYCDIGAYTRHIKQGNFVNGAESYYSTEAWRAIVHGVYTNTPATAHMRAPTGPIANFAAETMVDEIAHELGQDPLNFRANNVPTMYQNSALYTNNSMKECLLEGAELFNWREKWQDPFKKKVKKPYPDRSLRTGVGVSMGTWHSGVGKGDAFLKVKRDGTFEVYVGVIDIGTGAKSTMAQIASKTLGVPITDIRIVYGDTAICPYSVGESGSRTTTFTGNAVREAASKLREKLLELATLEFSKDKKREELALFEGSIYRLKNGQRQEKLASLGELLSSQPAGFEEEITEQVSTEQKLPEGTVRETFAAHFAEVSVDTETGEISVEGYLAYQECGEIVNKLTATSQIR